jgi:tetraacyldisaccharide 4'-kinase
MLKFPVRTRNKVVAIMHGEGRRPVLSLATLLHFAACFYGGAQKLKGLGYRHHVFPSKKLPCKVISVGNITVGGTGKTPMTIHLSEVIQQLGYRVAIVSRGYMGKAENGGGIVSNGKTICMPPAMAGDEPYLMAARLRGVPVVVGKNRFKSGMAAVGQFQPEVIILDDAFQHLKLKRDIDLVLLDQMRPVGNGQLLPRGTLREPIDGLARGTACVLTRCRAGANLSKMASYKVIKPFLPAGPVFTSCHVPYGYMVKSGHHIPFQEIADFFSASEFAQFTNARVYGFSGIGRNDDFQLTVKKLGFQVTGFSEFCDHHRYTPSDLQTILRTAEKSGAHRLITTEKDHVRITEMGPLPMALIVVGVKIRLGEGPPDFTAFIQDRLQGRDSALHL